MLHRRIRQAAALLAVVLGVALTPLPAAPVVADPAPPLRIALLGDSITHGSTGDFTWRYFAWKHLVADGVDADLVGPENDLWEHSNAYADPDFDHDHAARWGDAYAWLAHPVPQLMAGSHPDVLVILLGLNDLTFAKLTPQQVLDQTHLAVQQAQAANPDVKLVLCRLPTTWIGGVTDFNTLLSNAGPGWSTQRSRVVIAASDTGYNQSTAEAVRDTWDPVHPDASGEQKIAAAVSDSLAELGIGSPYPRPLASLPLGPRTRPVLSAAPADGAANLSWTNPPGATSERIWVRDLTAGEAEVMVRSSAGSAVRLGGLVNGHLYEVSLQAAKGLVPANADRRSNSVRLRPVKAVPGRVPTPRARPRQHAFTVAWSAVSTARSYRVWWRNTSRTGDGWSSRPTTARSMVVRHAEAGARYAVRVQAVGPGGVGALSPPAYAVPHGPRPGAPRHLTARLRAHTVTLRWGAVAHATRYVVHRRDVTHHGRWQSVVTGGALVAHSMRLGGLRAATTYAFTVTALHQRVVGGTSRIVLARPRP